MKKQPINRIEIGQGIFITHNSGNVLTVYFDNVFDGWEQYIFLASDQHHDSTECNRDLEREHLEQVKQRNACAFFIGDLYDCMQGKYDPRRSYSNLRPEYKVDNYLDEIVRDGADFYAPYVTNILMMGRGNHESSILKNNGVDLIGNLVHRLNADHGGHIQAGGYGGWIRLIFKIGTTKSESLLIKYNHGSGGGGPVTRGVIQTNRQAVYLPDADIVVNGHTHDGWYVPIARERISDLGNVYQDIQHHIRTTTYKNDYGDGSGGWHIETGKPPKPMGAAWVRLTVNQSHKTAGRRCIRVEPILALE